MAEGGVEEMAKAYQTATEKMCELCLEEDSFKQATWYCKQCRRGLCDKCRKYHRKVPVLKDHEVVRAEEMPPVIPQSTEELSDELRTPMCTTHNLPIELYCEDHNQPVCNSCKLVDHRKCKRLSDLKHVATKNTGKSNEVLQHLKSIDHGIDQIGVAITKECQAMEVRKEKVIHKIKNQMQQIEVMGHKKISEVEKMIEKEQKSLQREKESIKQTQQLVSKSIGDIETATQTGSEEEMFLITIHAEKEAQKYQDFLNDISQVTHTEVDLEVDSRLTDIDYFGKIELKKCKVSVDVKPHATDYLYTKSSLPINWFHVLPGEQVIALQNDKRRHHLSLYSLSTGLLSQLDLPGVAFSADTLNDHQVIVAIPVKQCLLIVDSVNNKLVQKDTIQLIGKPGLILKYSEQSMLMLDFTKHTDGKFCFQILDLRGNIQTAIPIKEIMMNPLSMRMSTTRDIVYINDTEKGCYGFNLQGDTLFHYTQSNAKQYLGLVVDHHNCVYLHIQDQDGNHLTKLSPTGQHLKRIDCDYGFPMRYDRNKLYLLGKNPQNKRLIRYIYVW